MGAEDDRDVSPFGAFTRRPVNKRGARTADSVDSPSPSAPASTSVVSQAPDATAAEQQASLDRGDTVPDDLIEVGYIAQAYGVRGQVKIFPHATVGDGGDALLAAKYWWIAGGRPRTLRRVKVSSAKPHSGAVTAALAGSDDRNSAEALRGSTVSVRRADFPKLDAGEYYWVDLIGLDVANPAGTALGRVSGLIDNGAHSVLRVAYASVDAAGKSVEAERLIPFVDAYLREVDLAGKRIVVDWDVDY